MTTISDRKTYVSAAITALETAIGGSVDSDILNYTIQGRTIEKMSQEDRRKTLDQFRGDWARIMRAERFQRTGKAGTIIKATF